MKDGLDAADSAHALQILVAVAELGSFTAAAVRLGLSPSAISKAVTRTEARLGVELVRRTTRSIAFTDHGAAYVERGKRVLAELEANDSEASARVDAVRGTLRVSAPAVYGALKVAPVVAALQRRHPALDVELRCHDRLVDMVAERIDVAVRILSAPPAEFVARALGDDRRGLFASPAYLRRAGTPIEAADLSRHAAITYSSGSGALLPSRRGRVVFATDSVLAAREAGRAGLGIVELPDYLAAEDVAGGALREVVPGAIPTSRKVYAIYLAHRHLSANVRALVDALSRRR